MGKIEAGVLAPLGTSPPSTSSSSHAFQCLLPLPCDTHPCLVHAFSRWDCREPRMLSPSLSPYCISHSPQTRGREVTIDIGLVIRVQTESVKTFPSPLKCAQQMAFFHYHWRALKKQEVRPFAVKARRGCERERGMHTPSLTQGLSGLGWHGRLCPEAKCVGRVL